MPLPPLLLLGRELLDFAVFALVFTDLASTYLCVSQPRASSSNTDYIVFFFSSPTLRSLPELILRESQSSLTHLSQLGSVPMGKFDVTSFQAFKSLLRFPDLEARRLSWLSSNSIRTKKASWVYCCLSLGKQLRAKGWCKSHGLWTFSVLALPNLP